MLSHKKISILIPDVENYSMIHVLNCLAKLDNALIYVMTTEKMGLKYSRYIKNQSIYPPTDDLVKRMENIKSEVLKYDIDIIMPVHDSGVADLINGQNHILNPDKIILLPSLEAYKTVTNKGLLSLHLKKHGLSMPETWILKRNHPLKYRESNLNFPFIIKPSTNSMGGFGVVLIDTEKSLQKYIRSYAEFEEFVIQEFIEGEDWGCSVLCLNGFIKAHSIQRSVNSEKNQFTPGTGIELILDDRPLKMIEKLTKSLHWTGVAHIDMRYDKNKKRFVIIEMNARYWSSIFASAVGGVNFPYLHVLLSLGKDFTPPSYKAIEYLKFKGACYKLKKNKWFLFKFTFLKSNTEIGSLMRDPILTLYRTLSYLRRNF